ncbi:hypothetical protein ACF1AJ_14045 [Leifsonia sp. NPDC014704]|uniref:hypothetical protein n=1 Tax=Leifsonia sp. NPDC014704 TaxID=3364123 RepID=UPI0036F4907C
MTKGKRLVLPIAAAALALSGLVGCTGSPSSPWSAGSGSTNARANGSTPLPTIPAGTGIISDTKMTSCDTTGSEVTATGTVTMPKDRKGDVVVSVSWVNSTSSSVYGRGVTTLKDVGSGDKKEWATSATLPAGAESVSCVLGAVVPE